MTEIDKNSFEKLKTTHDGHGRVSCKTRTELNNFFDLELVDKIMNRICNIDFVELSYEDFMEVVND